ncbi:MAG: diacylglycerol kinase, partial [Calditrichia bacterium]|nr:diacylglycerol kinase [Calditrichia bacterium]
MPQQKLKYFFILNPGSKGGKSKKLITNLFSILNELKIDYEYAFTKNLNDAQILSQKANLQNYNVIVAV